MIPQNAAGRLSMKGLLYKDFINLKQQARYYVMIVGIWAVISVMNRNPEFFGGLMAMFCILMPLTAFAYDEKAGWDKYALTMPVTRRKLVVSRYVFGLLILSVSAVLTLAVCLAENMGLTEVLVMIAVLGSIGMICMAFTFPVVLRFGAEKARTVLILIVLIPIACGLVAEQAGLQLPDGASLERMIWLLPVSAMAGLLVSLGCSMRIYEKKEF